MSTPPLLACRIVGRYPALCDHRHRAVACLLAVILVSLALTGAPPTARADQQPPLSVTTNQAVSELLAGLQLRSDASDPRYLENDVWIDGSPTCVRCTIGPAVLAASRGSSVGNPDPSLIAVSITTMDAAIRNHQDLDGSFGPAAPGEGGKDIQTVMMGNELAWTMLILGDQLDAEHRDRWSDALAASADWLIGNGNLTWYINGNINLAVAMNMDLTYRITGESRFQEAAETALTFTISPPQDLWRGFGLRYTTRPSAADGSDGAAYLAESGGGAPGFDPAYTLAQVNLASMWYLLTDDPTAKRLTNLLYNQIAPRVRWSDWTVDVSGGTRRNAPGLRYAYDISALAVLALKGGRTNLQSLAKRQIPAALTDYKNTARYVSPQLSYNMAAELTAIHLVVTTTPNW